MITMHRPSHLYRDIVELLSENGRRLSDLRGAYVIDDGGRPLMLDPEEFLEAVDDTIYESSRWSSYPSLLQFTLIGEGFHIVSHHDVSRGSYWGDDNSTYLVFVDLQCAREGAPCLIPSVK